MGFLLKSKITFVQVYIYIVLKTCHQKEPHENTYFPSEFSAVARLDIYVETDLPFSCVLVVFLPSMDAQETLQGNVNSEMMSSLYFQSFGSS